MKIWMPCIETGTGAEVYTRRLARGLSDRGHDVQLDLIPHRYQYYPWLSPIRPDPRTEVILANSWTAAAFALDGIPMVSVVHHVVHESIEHMAKSITQRIFHSAYIKPMELAALKRSSRIVAVSRSTERAIRDVFGEWNVDVVLNGVDTEFFTPGSDSDCSTAPENRPLELLFVGKRSRRKGFDLIANLVDELGPLARFTCIGGQAKARLKLPPGQYPGRVSLAELRNAYRRSDALLMLSRLEGFGYAAAEAMACGTPVVCLEGTAVHEIAGPTAITAEFDAAGKPTAETIAQLRDLAKLRGLRSLAREKARTELSEVRWLDQMEDVIQSAISHTGSLLAP